MKIIDVIAELTSILKRKITYEAIGEALNVSKQYIGQIKEKELSTNQIQKIEKHFSVSLTKVNNTIKTTTEEKIAIDYYPDVFGSCGSGKFVLSTQKEVIDVPKKLFQHFSSVKKYSVINAVGDSMSPTIYDKDKLIVEHWEGEQIKDNQVYVFAYNNEIFVKRLVKNVDEIVITSDNPNPIYRPRFIEKDEMNNVLIIGQIVGLFRELR